MSLEEKEKSLTVEGEQGRGGWLPSQDSISEVVDELTADEGLVFERVNV